MNNNPVEVSKRYGFEYAPMKITFKKKVILSELSSDHDYYNRKLRIELIGIFAFGLTMAVLLIIAFFEYVG